MRRVMLFAVVAICLVVGGLLATGSVKPPEPVDQWMAGDLAFMGATKAEARESIERDRLAIMESQLNELRGQIEHLASNGARAEFESGAEMDALRMEMAALANSLPKAPDYARMQEAAVLVDTGNGGHGSGVIIGPRAIMTAAHVVRGREKKGVTVEFFDGSRIKGEVAWLGAENKRDDYAVVTLEEDAPYAPATISCDAPQIGDRLVAVGSPLSARWVISHLQVASARQWHESVPNGIVVQGALEPGQSGGAVYNMDGEIVGLVHVAFIVPLGIIPNLSGFSGVFSATKICGTLPTVERASAD